MSFPTTLPTYIITAGSESPNTTAGGTGLSGLLNAFETDITAIGTKLGTGASVAAANQILLGNGAGTSTWSGLTSAQLLSIMSDETGTGSVVFANTPTIVTPTIASFTNANHNHTNAAGGGTIGASAITGVTTTVINNPYKFSVFLGANQTITTSVSTVIAFDTKTFDTGTNIDIATNKGRFTAPVAGFYQFNATGNGTSATGAYIVELRVNGTVQRRLAQSGGANGGWYAGSGLQQLNANDYVEISVFQNSGGNITLNGQAGLPRLVTFDGFLVSTT